jgi:glycosyltransferase involved in cell wall biosynthesis
VKVVFLCEAVFPENKGGVERWFGQLSRELSNRGHEVLYLNASGVNGNRSGVEYLSITRRVWSYLPGGVRSKKQAIFFAYAAFWKLRSLQTDAIYTTAVPILSVFPVGMIRLLRRRVQTFVEWFEIWPLSYWLKYAGFISGSLGWLVQFMALQIGKYRIVYTDRAARSVAQNNLIPFTRNIVRLPGLCSSIFDHQVKIGDIRNDVVFLGRFVDEKQPNLAIEAIVEFTQSGWTGNFWIIGKGPSLISMKELLELNPEASHQIHIVENATDDAVIEHLKKSFALLHTSKREGYGLASVEAAYLGTPSILLNYPSNAALDLGISPDLVVDELNPAGIASKLDKAFKEQMRLRQETLAWAENASLSMSLKSTVDRIEGLLGVTNDKKN